MSNRRSLAWLLLAAACTRPVAGTDQGSARIADLVVAPSAIKADVPIDLSFVIGGTLPEVVTWDLAGHTGECTPELASEGRLHCVLPGIGPPDYAQGRTLAVVKARDDEGRESIATTQVIIDFDCPRFLSLTVTPAIAAPGTSVTVAIEASETLRDPPRVLRSGRDWETPLGEEQSFTVSHAVTAGDPAGSSELLIKLTDLAGNTSDDCGADGHLPFAVDQSPPLIDPSKVMVLRDAPGSPTTISAAPGAFVDDAAIAEVRVWDESATTVLATLHPAADGSLPSSSLGAQSRGRIQLEAIDRLEHSSARIAVPERWRLSVGLAATPEAAVKTAVRFSAPPAQSSYLSNRTQELAPALLTADTRSATVRAKIGFEPAGRLPNAYEDAIWISSGYDGVGKAIVAYGGVNTVEDPDGFDAYHERTLILRWNERLERYDVEYGQPYIYGQTPTGRGGHTIEFDGRGCGIMFGGEGLQETEDPTFYFVGALDDVWQICLTDQGYRWSKISPTGEVPSPRRTPIVYDPLFDRYLVANGRYPQGGFFPLEDVFILQPGATPDAWSWNLLTPLPTTLGGRYSHLAYWDAAAGGIALGLGYVYPGTERRTYWLYKNGQWTTQGQVPPELDSRQGFGFAYDTARSQLVMWGDNELPPAWDTDTWFLTGTATNAVGGWRRVDLDPPVPRAWPTLVYDPDREVTVVYGGQRFDGRFVPADIHQLVSAPSYPYLVASIDLAAGRPKGIERLTLALRANGYGDRDGVSPGLALEGGVIVKLWDHNARAWIDVANQVMTAGAGPQTITVEVSSNVERFVSPTGVVPISLVTRAPATEAIEAVLDVDQIDGQLELRQGVALP